MLTHRLTAFRTTSMPCHKFRPSPALVLPTSSRHPAANTARTDFVSVPTWSPQSDLSDYTLTHLPLAWTQPAIALLPYHISPNKSSLHTTCHQSRNAYSSPQPNFCVNTSSAPKWAPMNFARRRYFAQYCRYPVRVGTRELFGKIQDPPPPAAPDRDPGPRSTASPSSKSTAFRRYPV